MKIVLDKNWEIVENALRNSADKKNRERYSYMTSEELSEELLWQAFMIGRKDEGEPFKFMDEFRDMEVREATEWFLYCTGKDSIESDVFWALCALRVEEGMHETEDEVSDRLYWESVQDREDRLMGN